MLASYCFLHFLVFSSEKKKNSYTVFMWSALAKTNLILQYSTLSLPDSNTSYTEDTNEFEDIPPGSFQLDPTETSQPEDKGVKYKSCKHCTKPKL